MSVDGHTPEVLVVPTQDPYCFVCRRATEHVAEHDDLVDAGLAAYGWDGTVYSIALDQKQGA